MSGLRKWQQEALDKYLSANPRDFLAVATPGAGKTTFALRIAAELLARRIIQKLEGDRGQKHVDEYADSTTERGQCLLSTICKEMHFDSLGYQSLDGLLEAIGLDRDKICTYCWTGKE